MLQLLNRFVDLCLLRAGPQHLPASVGVTALALVGYMLAALLFLGTGEGNANPGLPVLSIALMVVTTAVMLRITGNPERLMQTLSALGGAGTIVMLALTPMLAALPSSETEITLTFTEELIFTTYIGLWLWSFVIEGSIYRHALNIPLPLGILISIGVTIFALAVQNVVFPVAA